MSQPKSPDGRESLPENKDILKKLETYFSEHSVTLPYVLGMDTPIELTDHRLVVKEAAAPGQSLFLDLRSTKDLTEAKFYPKPVQTESDESPHYTLQETDRFVAFVDEIWPTEEHEEHSVIVIGGTGEIAFASKHYIGPVMTTDGEVASARASLSQDMFDSSALRLLNHMLQTGQPIAPERLRMFDQRPNDPIDKYFAHGVLYRSPDTPVPPRFTEVSPGIWAIGEFSVGHLINTPK